MSNRDDDDLVLQKTVHNLIGKSRHQHTACSTIPRDRADFGLRLNESYCMSDGIEELSTQSGPLLFVPADGGGKLFACGFEVSQLPGHLPRMSRAMRRFTLSHDS